VTTTTGERSAFAAQLRNEFDHAFSLPVRVETVKNRHLLAIRIGGDPYALNPEEIAGLHVDRAIVAVPGTLSEWLGLAGIRGELVPVYSLAALLGYEQSTSTRTRWLALCGSGQLLGLAFDAFERHLNLTLPQIAAADPTNIKTEHVRAVAHADDMSRPVISIPSITAEIARRCANVGVSKEK
jgi:chemotaxis signal transduction protein